jgi:2-polyprenyl-6-methoxyphenol hydroxylase-like FAD-dependent oxidoreductase
MPRAVVVGGSLTGLTTALALSRAGWQVDVVERDPLPDAPDVEAAFRHHPRHAVPQAGHSHGFFAGTYTTLRDRAPDLLDAVFAAGVSSMRVRDYASPAVRDTPPEPVDDDLIALAARRSTYEWAVRRFVANSPGVSLRVGNIAGLVGTPGRVPHITGVRLDDGSVDADLVVDASGRRSSSPAWIGELGGRDAPWEAQDCEATYYTRYYRLRDPQAAWLPMNRGAAAGGQFQAHFAIAIPGDNATFSITLVVPPYVKAFRALRYPEVFEAVCAVTPLIAPWIEPDYAEPITDIRVIAGFHNSIRRDVTAAPYAVGFAMMGDSFMHTDPTFARGVSIATISAFRFADIVSEHADPTDRDAAWRTFQSDVIVPRYEDVVARDGERHEMWSATWGGGQGVEPAVFGDLSWSHLPRAAAVDADVWRVVNRYMQVLESFDAVFTPAIFDRVRELRDADLLPTPPSGPTPDELIATIETASAQSADATPVSSG